MKTIQLLFILCAVSFSSSSYAQYILKFQADSMGDYIGETFKIRVTETNTDFIVGAKTLTTLSDTMFSIDLYVLLDQRDYQVDFYVDVNGNGMYDPPPVDHAWRRMISNATADTALDFVPDTMYTDIAFEDGYPYSTYNATWGGKWMNQTFGSTDSIEASFNLACDSVMAWFSTKGVFGNPQVVEFEFSDAIEDGLDVVNDTIFFYPDDPWSGEVFITNGELHGDISSLGFGLQFTGTVGQQQVLSLYTVSTGGNPFANGYFYVRELEVMSSSPTLTLELIDLTNATCFGDDDGSITTMASGGTPDYMYMWSSTDTLAALNNLSAGAYDVTVTDSQGCTVKDSYLVNEPEMIVITGNVENVSCAGGDDGSITTMVTGGTPDYLYMWSTSDTLAALDNLIPGAYDVTVTDSQGCIAQDSYLITEPEVMVITGITDHATCFGACDGIASVMVAGGQPPYQYIWMTGQATQTIEDLCADDYIVTVIDDAGCEITITLTIQEPPEIVIDDIIVVDETGGMSDGSITVMASGGTPPFSYSIDGITYQSSNIFANLPAGNYAVYISDESGCSIDSITVVISNVTSIGKLEARFNWYPNPVRDILYFTTDRPLDVSILDLNGRLLSTTEVVQDAQLPVGELRSGIYLLRCSDGKHATYQKLIIAGK